MATRMQKIRVAAARVAHIRKKYGLTKYLPSVRADLNQQECSAATESNKNAAETGRKLESDETAEASRPGANTAGSGRT